MDEDKELVYPVTPSRDTVCSGNKCRKRFHTSYQTEKEINWRCCRQRGCERWFCGGCSTNRDDFMCKACAWKKKQQRSKGRGGDRSRWGKVQSKMTIESETVAITDEFVVNDPCTKSPSTPKSGRKRKGLHSPSTPKSVKIRKLKAMQSLSSPSAKRKKGLQTQSPSTPKSVKIRKLKAMQSPIKSTGTKGRNLFSITIQVEGVEGAQVQPVVKEDPPAPVQEEARTPDPAPLALVEQQLEEGKEQDDQTIEKLAQERDQMIKDTNDQEIEMGKPRDVFVGEIRKEMKNNENKHELQAKGSQGRSLVKKECLFCKTPLYKYGMRDHIRDSCPGEELQGFTKEDRVALWNLREKGGAPGKKVCLSCGILYGKNSARHIKRAHKPLKDAIEQVTKDNVGAVPIHWNHCFSKDLSLITNPPARKAALEKLWNKIGILQNPTFKKVEVADSPQSPEPTSSAATKEVKEIPAAVTSDFIQRPIPLEQIDTSDFIQRPIPLEQIETGSSNMEDFTARVVRTEFTKYKQKQPVKSWADLVESWFTMYDGLGSRASSTRAKTFLLTIYELWKVKYDESIDMSENEHLDKMLTPSGLKLMLLECLPACRMDGVEGKLAASSQINKLKHLDEVVSQARILGVISEMCEKQLRKLIECHKVELLKEKKKREGIVKIRDHDNILSIKELLDMVFSPKYQELARDLQRMSPKKEIFNKVQGVLMLASLLLRASRSGEPMSMNLTEFEAADTLEVEVNLQQMKKVDKKKVKKIMLGRIETSPLKSSSVGDSEASWIESALKDYASLKTFKSEGAPSIYYTREMWDLLSAYVQKFKHIIEKAPDKQLFCSFDSKNNTSKRVAKRIRGALKQMGLGVICLRKHGHKITPTLLRKTVWTKIQRCLQEQLRRDNEIVSRSAGHSLSTGYRHYDLRNRRDTDDFVVSQNIHYLEDCRNNPDLLEEIEKTVIHPDDWIKANDLNEKEETENKKEKKQKKGKKEKGKKGKKGKKDSK